MRLLPFAALLLATSPALAGATDWQELAPDTRVRLITSDRLGADGTTLAAIELDMPQNTKTYWSVPGETGIATELDLTGSSGIDGQLFRWPYPSVEQAAGYTDFVYYGSLVIPLELIVSGDRAQIEASLLMGVCSDICIPATARFSLPLSFDRPDAGQEVRIAQALATTPIGWSGPGEPVGEPVLAPAGDALLVPVDDSIVDPFSVLADASESGHLLGAPQKSPQPGLVSLPLLGGGEGIGLEGKPVRIIFMTEDGPFEVTRRVKASTPTPS